MGIIDLMNMMSIDDVNVKLDKMLKGLEKLDKIVTEQEKRLKELEKR